MSRLLTLAVLGFGGLSLAAPQVSQAQTPVGVQVQVGPVGFNYQQGYSYVPRYVVPAPPVVVPPTVVVPQPVYTGWYWDGIRWCRHERWEGYHHHGHYGHHR
jgi:hypothetical protein